VIPEPAGGAHEDPDSAAALLKQGILSALDELEGIEPDERRRLRRAKYRRMGVLTEI
jgi:acetyl-CoA carboxylase alpha subunit